MRQGNSICMAAIWGEGNRKYVLYREGEEIETNKFNNLFIRGAHLGRTSGISGLVWLCFLLSIG
jgi:hypothetical protein